MFSRWGFSKKTWITQQHWAEFRELGYTVVRRVIPKTIRSAAVRDIYRFLGADPRDSNSWYSLARMAPQLDGVVPLHHSPAQWEMRQCRNLYEVFQEFFGTPRLIVDINRCIFRPPVTSEIPQISHGTIHWDTDPKQPGPASLQAVVMLSDVGPDGGGFQCIPEIYRNMDGWLAQNARASGFDFFNPGLNDAKTEQVSGNAGDVILWSTKLPHGTAVNLSDRPRFAAFVTMQPPAGGPEQWGETVECWRSRRAPAQWRGMPGQIDPEPGTPPVLSPLGRKLIGLEPWY